MKQFKYLDILTALFATVLVLSNITAAKLFSFGSFSLPGAIILFPLAYIFGDILTEVYGYARARRVIWIGFGMNILMVAVFWIVGKLPPSPIWNLQNSYDAILGMVPRIVEASIIAYLFGEFMNSFVLAKLKIKTVGKHLWFRAIGSTIVGQLFDSGIFICIAFWGTLPPRVVATIFLSQYIVKIAFEVILLPITYRVVAWLKKKENEDFYDTYTDFNPLHVSKE